MEPTENGGRVLLHVVEPTLLDQTGHCYSLVRSLVRAGGDARPEFHVWMRREAEPLFGGDAVEHPYFSRRWRRPQAAWLYRGLLRRVETTGGRERVLISTATTADLVALDVGAMLGAGRVVVPGRVWMYFHWVNRAHKKVRLLRRVARRHPGLEIVCSTPMVRGVFEAAGFERVQVAPYPGAVQEIRADVAAPFSHVLFAGAARMDKGFGAFVDLVELMRARASGVRVVAQCSPSHSGHSDEVAAAVARLKATRYAGLTLHEQTLDAADYERLFGGAVTVLLYDTKAFTDRVSGVMLDALRHGSPVVAVRGSWMARQVERFGAGVVVDDASDPAGTLAAINRVAAAWETYARATAAAGEVLSREHDAGQLIGLVTGAA